MSDVRVVVIGTGAVGRWLLAALHSQSVLLSSRYGFTPRVVGVANAHDGFVHDPQGLDLSTVLRLSSGRGALTEHPRVRHSESTLEGLAEVDADVLVEVSGSPRESGEPGLSHMREALRRAIPVVTSNKWPVALHGVELAASARSQGAAFRAESTVMSGTPVLSTLLEGLAGTTPVRLRGVLNATANFVLTEMEEGRSYEDALAEARHVGLAERDPFADVDGHDSVAKTMILAALVFGEQLRPEDVRRTGIAELGLGALQAARAAGTRIRLVSTLEYTAGGRLEARVEPLALSHTDRLAAVEGATNAVVLEAEPVGEVAIAGPGAGPELAGQGVLSDLIAVCRRSEPKVTRAGGRW